ncbi:CotS family spore coat protein [Candidatus Galacturonibacter soehngenii]|uniref:CotS family spore coat protein n=1 Tax=Candidatus Galacturonatibacter soehngenii TaxID=2307010 RepID=A0A7V7QJ09_9FIRM|nr:CotS family spore coat protein [Candidatus Galacturonibacter soehngenii]
MVSDKELLIWDQYDINVIRTYKGRQSIICETDKGLRLVKELGFQSPKIEFQNRVKKLLEDSKFYHIDCFVPNLNEELITRDKDESLYVMKEWYDGREIDVRNKSEILLAVKLLAMIHCNMVNVECDVTQSHRFEDLNVEFEKHNKELKKIRNFVRDKNKKTDYEICFISVFEMFQEDTIAATKRLEKSNYAKLLEDAIQKKCVCHGDYNHHNILITKNGPFITNFDKCKIGVQVSDLYNFMRKILEKNNWDINLGKEMIDTYHEIKNLNSDELENLLIRFIYPEKFWKIANHYYNSNKAWTPVKNIEKLQMLAAQNKIKWEFLNTVFTDYI